MTFSAAIAPMISRPASYASQILKTPSMRGYVSVFELTYENTAAGQAFAGLIPAGAPDAPGSVRRNPNAGAERIEVYVDSVQQWVAADRALGVRFFENDQYVDDDSSAHYTFCAAVAGQKYWWIRSAAETSGTPPATVPFVLDPQLFGLVAQADDWDRVDSSAIEALTSTARW